MNGGVVIPYMALGRTFSEHKQNLLEIYEEVGMSGQFVNGPALTDFEFNCAAVSGRSEAVSIATATDGLYFTMKALGIGPGDEVITTAYSYYATAEAIARTGATAVFADVDDHYHIDLSYAESVVQPNTKAILIVNLFGDMMDYDDVTDFAKKHKLLLIEDAAQSIGSFYNGIPSGFYGDASVYSFSPSKQISGMGHGACVVTDDRDLIYGIRELALHGRVPYAKGHMSVGHNSIMSSFEAAYLNYFIDIRDKLMLRRNVIASRYKYELADSKLIHMPLTRANAVHSYHKFVIRCSAASRSNLKWHLTVNGIESQIHYETLTPNEPYFSTQKNDLAMAMGFREFPNALRLSEESLSIPIYPELTDEEVGHIIHTLSRWNGT